MENLKKIKRLAEKPLSNDRAIKRVEIIVLKFKEEPRVIDKCISNIIHFTEWPFKLNVFDNRLNSANTSKAWNKLIKESTCDYVCFVDSDAFVPRQNPCWLSRMMESIEQTGIVVPMGNNVGGDNKALEPKPYPNYHIQNGIWSGFCFLLKKSIMDKIGWFDEDFYFYGQDSEFAYRCLKHGGAIYRDDVAMEHIGSYSMDKEPGDDRENDRLYASALYRLKTSGKL